MCAAKLFKDDDNKRVPCKGFRLPDPIEPGEIVTDQSLKKWKLGKSIGNGAFGEIYLATDDLESVFSNEAANACIKIEPHSNGPLYSEMHCYMRVAKPADVDKYKNEKRYVHFGMPKFYGAGSHTYKNTKYRFLVIERFGRDFQKILEQYGNKVPHKLAYQVGIQILNVLEYIHSKQYIHGDIKAANILTGNKKGTVNHFYLVDFGLATKYTVYGRHKKYQYDGRYANFGTIEFASRDAHIGVFSRRGDLEILAYNMTKWMCSYLPWEDKLDDNEYICKEKIKSINDIPLFMRKLFGDEDVQALQDFFVYVTNLTYDENPDYDKCRDILLKGSIRDGYTDDNTIIDLEYAFKHSLKISKSCFNLHTSINDEIKNNQDNEKEMEIDDTKHEADGEKEDIEKGMDIDEKINEKDCNKEIENNEKDIEIDDKKNEIDCEKEMEIEQVNEDEDNEKELEMEVDKSITPEPISESDNDEKESPQAPVTRRTRNTLTEPELSHKKKTKKNKPSSPEPKSESDNDEKESSQAPVTRRTRNNPTESETSHEKKTKKSKPATPEQSSESDNEEPSQAPVTRRTRNHPEIESSQEKKVKKNKPTTPEPISESDNDEEESPQAPVTRRTRNNHPELELLQEKIAKKNKPIPQKPSRESDDENESSQAPVTRRTRNNPTKPESPQEKKTKKNKPVTPEPSSESDNDGKESSQAPVTRRTRNNPTDPTESESSQKKKAMKNKPASPEPMSESDNDDESSEAPVTRRTRNHPSEPETLQEKKAKKNKPATPEPMSESDNDEESSSQAPVTRRTRNNPTEPESSQEKKSKKTTPVKRGTRNNPAKPEPVKDEKKTAHESRRTRHNPIESEPPQENKNSASSRKTRNKSPESDSPKEKQAAPASRKTRNNSTELESPKEKLAVPASRRTRNMSTESNSAKEKEAVPVSRKTRTSPVEPESPKDKQSDPTPRKTRNSPAELEASKDKQAAPTPRKTKNNPTEPDASKEKEVVPTPRKTRNSPTEPETPKEKESVQVSRRTRNHPGEPESSKDNKATPVPRKTRNNPSEPDSPREEKDDKKVSVVRGTRNKHTEPESTKENKAAEPESTKENKAAEPESPKEGKETPVPRRTRNNPIEPDQLPEKKDNKTAARRRTRHGPSEPESPKEEKDDENGSVVKGSKNNTAKEESTKEKEVASPKEEKVAPVQRRTRNNPVEPEPLREKKENVTATPRRTRNNPTEQESPKEEEGNKKGQKDRGTSKDSTESVSPKEKKTALATRSTRNHPNEPESPEEKKAAPTPRRTRNNPSEPESAKEKTTDLGRRGTRNNTTKPEISKEKNENKQLLSPNVSRSNSPEPQEEKTKESTPAPRSSRNNSNRSVSSKEENKSLTPRRLKYSSTGPKSQKGSKENLRKSLLKGSRKNTPEPELEKDEKENLKVIKTNLSESDSPKEKKIPFAISEMKNNSATPKPTQEDKNKESTPAPRRTRKNPIEPEPIQEKIESESSDEDLEDLMIKAEKKKLEERKKKYPEKYVFIRKDNFDNPTPQMKQLMEQIRKKAEMPHVCTKRHKHKKACNVKNVTYDETPYYYTPEMEAVIRQRDMKMLSQPMVYEPLPEIPQPIPKEDRISQMEVQEEPVDDKINESIDDLDQDLLDCFDANVNAFVNANMSSILNESIMNLDDSSESNMDIDLDTNLLESRDVDTEEISNLLEQSGISVEQNDIIEIGEKLYGNEENMDLSSSEKVATVENINDKNEIPGSSTLEKAVLSNIPQHSDLVATQQLDLNTLMTSNEKEVQCVKNIDSNEVQFIQESSDKDVIYDQTNNDEIQYIGESKAVKTQSVVNSDTDKAQSVVEDKIDEVKCIESNIEDGKPRENVIEEVQYIGECDISKVQSMVESNDNEDKCIESNIDVGVCSKENYIEESNIGVNQSIEGKNDKAQNIEENNSNKAQIVEKSNIDDNVSMELDDNESKGAKESNNVIAQDKEETNVEESNENQGKGNESNVDDVPCVEDDIVEIKSTDEQNADKIQCIEEQNLDNIQGIDDVQFIEERNNDEDQCNEIEVENIKSNKEIQSEGESNVSDANVVQSKCSEIDIDKMQHIEESSIGKTQSVMESNNDNVLSILENKCTEIDANEAEHIEESNIGEAQSVVESNNDNVLSILERKCAEIDVDEAEHTEESNIDEAQSIVENNDHVQSIIESKSDEIHVDEVEHTEESNIDEAQGVVKSNDNVQSIIEGKSDEMDVDKVEESNISETQSNAESNSNDVLSMLESKCNEIDNEVELVEECDISKTPSIVESNINAQNAVESKCDEIDIEVEHVESNVGKDLLVESNVDNVQRVESECDEIDIDEVEHVEESNIIEAPIVVESNIDNVQSAVETQLGKIRIDDVQPEVLTTDTSTSVMESNIDDVPYVVGDIDKDTYVESNIEEIQPVVESNINESQRVIEDSIDNEQCNVGDTDQVKHNESRSDEVLHVEDNVHIDKHVGSSNDSVSAVIESNIDEAQHIESDIATGQCDVESNIDNVESSEEIDIDEVQYVEESYTGTAQYIKESDIANIQNLEEGGADSEDISNKDIFSQVQSTEEPKSVEAQYIEDDEHNDSVQCIEDDHIEQVESVENNSGAIISVSKDVNYSQGYKLFSNYSLQHSNKSNFNEDSVLNIQQLNIKDDTLHQTVDHPVDCSRGHDMVHEGSESQVVSQNDAQLHSSTVSTNSELDVNNDAYKQEVQIPDAENIPCDENVNIRSFDKRSNEESEACAFDQNTLLKATQQLTLSNEENSRVIKEVSNTLTSNTLAQCPEKDNSFSENSELDTEIVHKSPVSTSLLDSNQQFNVNILSHNLPDACTKPVIESTLPEEPIPGSKSPSSIRQNYTGSQDLPNSVRVNSSLQESVSLHSSIIHSSVIPQTHSLSSINVAEEVYDSGIKENPNLLIPSECKDIHGNNAYCEDKHEETLPENKTSSCSETYCEDDDIREETLSEYEENDPDIKSMSTSNQEVIIQDNLVAQTPENIHQNLDEDINVCSSSPIVISPKADSASVLKVDASDIQEQNINDISKDDSMHEKNVCHSSPIRTSPGAGTSSLLKGDDSDIQKINNSGISKDDSMQVKHDKLDLSSNVSDTYVNTIPNISETVCSKDNDDDTTTTFKEGKICDKSEMQIDDAIPEVCKPFSNQNDGCDLNLSNIQAEFTSNVENVDENKETSHSMSNLEEKCTWYPKPLSTESSMERENSQSIVNLEEKATWYPKPQTVDSSTEKVDGQIIPRLEEKSTWYPKPSTIDSSMEKEISPSTSNLVEKCTWYPKPSVIDSSTEKGISQSTLNLEEKCTWYPKPSTDDSSKEKEISQPTSTLEEKCTWYPKSTPTESSRDSNNESVVDVFSHKAQSSNTGSIPGKTNEGFGSDIKSVSANAILQDNISAENDSDALVIDDTTDSLKSETKIIEMEKPVVESKNSDNNLKVDLKNLSLSDNQIKKHEFSEHLQTLKDDSEMKDFKSKRRKVQRTLSQSSQDESDFSTAYPDSFSSQDDLATASDSDDSAPQRPLIRPIVIQMDKELGSPVIRPPIKSLIIKKGPRSVSPVRLKRSNSRIGHWELICMKKTKAALNLQNRYVDYNVLPSTMRITRSISSQTESEDSASQQVSDDENYYHTPNLNERKRQERVGFCELSAVKKTASTLKIHNIKNDILPPVMRITRGISSQSTESDESSYHQVSKYNNSYHSSQFKKDQRSQFKKDRRKSEPVGVKYKNPYYTSKFKKEQHKQDHVSVKYENPYHTSQFKKEQHKQDRVGVCELSAIKESAASLSIHRIESDVLPPELRITRSITRPLEPEKKRKRKRQYQSLAEYIQDNYQDESSVPDVHMQQIAGTSSESNQYRLTDVKQISRSNDDYVQDTPKIKKSTMKRYKRKRKLGYEEDSDFEYDPYKNKKFKIENQPGNINRKEKRRMTADSFSKVIKDQFEYQDFDDEADSEYNPYKARKTTPEKRPKNKKNKNERRKSAGDSVSKVVQKEIDNQDFIMYRRKYYEKYLSQSTNFNQQQSPFNLNSPFNQSSPLNLSINEEQYTNTHCQPVNIYSDNPSRVLSSDVSEDPELHIRSDVLPPEMRITRSIR